MTQLMLTTSGGTFLCGVITLFLSLKSMRRAPDGGMFILIGLMFIVSGIGSLSFALSRVTAGMSGRYLLDVGMFLTPLCMLLGFSAIGLFLVRRMGWPNWIWSLYTACRVKSRRRSERWTR